MLELDPNFLDESTREFRRSEGEVRPLGSQSRARQTSLVFHYLMDLEIGDRQIWEENFGNEVRYVSQQIKQSGYDLTSEVEKYFKSHYDLFSRKIGDEIRGKLVEAMIVMGYELKQLVYNPQLHSDIYLKLDRLLFLNQHFPKQLGELYRDNLLKKMIGEILIAGAEIGKKYR